MRFADHYGIRPTTLDNGEKVIGNVAPAEYCTKTASVRLL